MGRSRWVMTRIISWSRPTRAGKNVLNPGDPLSLNNGYTQLYLLGVASTSEPAGSPITLDYAAGGSQQADSAAPDDGQATPLLAHRKDLDARCYHGRTGGRSANRRSGRYAGLKVRLFAACVTVCPSACKPTSRNSQPPNHLLRWFQRMDPETIKFGTTTAVPPTEVRHLTPYSGELIRYPGCQEHWSRWWTAPVTLRYIRPMPSTTSFTARQCGCFTLIFRFGTRHVRSCRSAGGP